VLVEKRRYLTSEIRKKFFTHKYKKILNPNRHIRPPAQKGEIIEKLECNLMKPGKKEEATEEIISGVQVRSPILRARRPKERV